MQTNGVLRKDLKRFGRNLNQTILIDCSSGYENQNTINIGAWKGKKNDAELAELCPLLAMIALKKLRVPEALKKYR